MARAPGSIFYTVEDFEAEHQLGDARLWADVMALEVGRRNGWGGMAWWHGPPRFRLQAQRMRGALALVQPAGSQQSDNGGGCRARAQGDASDNIPGVKGIGAVIALKLVQAFGTVEDILAHPTLEGVKVGCGVWRELHALCSAAEKRALAQAPGHTTPCTRAAPALQLTTHDTPPLQVRKNQREVLESDDGKAAARLAKELVTLVTDLQQPAVT